MAWADLSREMEDLFEALLVPETSGMRHFAREGRTSMTVEERRERRNSLARTRRTVSETRRMQKAAYLKAWRAARSFEQIEKQRERTREWGRKKRAEVSP